MGKAIPYSIRLIIVSRLSSGESISDLSSELGYSLSGIRKIIVEGLQGTLNVWANPKAQNSIENLQKRLDEESDFQRNYYHIPEKNHKTRI